MDDEKKASFVFMESYWEALDLLETDEEKYRFLSAIIEYGLFKKIPPLENESKTFRMGWLYTQPHLDAQKRKRGGQPGNKNAVGKRPKTQQKRIKRIKNESPNVNVNVNDNDNDKLVSFSATSNESANESQMSDEEWEAMIDAL